MCRSANAVTGRPARRCPSSSPEARRVATFERSWHKHFAGLRTSGGSRPSPVPELSREELAEYFDESERQFKAFQESPAALNRDAAERAANRVYSAAIEATTAAATVVLNDAREVIHMKWPGTGPDSVGTNGDKGDAFDRANTIYYQAVEAGRASAEADYQTTAAAIKADFEPIKVAYWEARAAERAAAARRK